MAANLVVLACGALTPNTTTAQTFFLEQIFNAPNPSAYDQFGTSVAVSGEDVLISAPAKVFGNAPAGPGRAFLFDASTGVLLQTFNDPIPAAGDQFGLSVDVSGNNVLIGAPHPTFPFFIGDNVGQAYLFDAATGDLLRTFNVPASADLDVFGSSVAISGDNALIGAGFFKPGRVFLFDAATGDLRQTFSHPIAGVVGFFGIAVAISGNNVLIGDSGDGTNGESAGRAFLFDTASGSLLRIFDDPSPAAFNEFGRAVAISSNHVLIGAPMDDTTASNAGRTFLFDVATGELLETFEAPNPAAGDLFGMSVDVNGGKVAIGAPNPTGPFFIGVDLGQAFLFDAASGDLLGTFDDPSPAEDDSFGSSVAVGGHRVLIGANLDDTNGVDTGQAFLFSGVSVSGAVLPIKNSNYSVAKQLHSVTH